MIREINSNIRIYLVILLLLICSRFFDIYTTYLATPDLTKESNFMVRYLEFGWSRLIFMNILIILVFFFLFRYSWSKLIAKYRIKQDIDISSSHEFKNYIGYPIINKPINPCPKYRNVFLEIGITLPIYVIITGYFQGIVNIMIHLDLIIVSFSILLYLYPIIIGGIFGYISLYLSKKFLYLRHPGLTRKAHKVMVPKIRVEYNITTQNPQIAPDTFSPEKNAQSLYSQR